MEPISGTGIVVIAGGVILIGVGAYLLLKGYCRLVLSANTVNVALYGTVSVTATLEYKSWAFGTWTPVPATFTISISGTASGTVAGGPATTAASPAATVNISGAALGPGTVTVTATGGNCANRSGVVSVSVP